MLLPLRRFLQTIMNTKTNTNYNGNELGTYRREAIQAAKDLCYKEKVITDLYEAKNMNDISVIMCNARKGLY